MGPKSRANPRARTTITEYTAVIEPRPRMRQTRKIWKRELNLKMEVLNVRTDNAIARLVRERLAAKKGAAAAKEDGEGVAGQLQGVEVLEGIRLREQEEEEEGRRERELDELDGIA